MNSILTRLNQINYKSIIWLLAIAETIHYIEEAIWLPEWSKTVTDLQPAVGAFEFRFAVIILTLIFYGIIYYFSKSSSKFSNYIMGGALAAIFLNVFIPHLLVTIITVRYAPGVISGILLNIPVIYYLVSRGIKEGYFKPKMLIISGVVFTIVIFPLLPVLFVIGKEISHL